MNETEIKIKIIPPEGGWKERTYYVVDVMFSEHNVPHRSIFYTGFLNGKDKIPSGYETIFNPTYDRQYSWRDVNYMKAISEIQDMKEAG